MRRWVLVGVSLAVVLTTTNLVSAQDQLPGLPDRGWWWPWGMMIGGVALITAACFKNPKRSHDN